MSLLEESYEPPLPQEQTVPRPPVQTYQLRRELRGVGTEIAIQTFDDRILVLVTQSGKVGCLVSRIALAISRKVVVSGDNAQDPTHTRFKHLFLPSCNCLIPLDRQPQSQAMSQHNTPKSPFHRHLKLFLPHRCSVHHQTPPCTRFTSVK